MNQFDLCETFGDVREDYVFRARERRKRHILLKLKWGAIAACVCLMIGGVFFALKPSQPVEELYSDSWGTQGPVEGQSGIFLPLPEVEMPDKTMAAGMIAFFIYQNRWYEWYGDIADESLVGEYIGTADGSIDEWTTPDGYVNFAGSIFGDFYTVKGYDPDILLCVANGDAIDGAYLCTRGITLDRGSDLYADRLRLADYTDFTYEMRKSWYYGEGEVKTYTGEKAAVNEFIEALCNGEFMMTDDISAANSIYDDMEVYHLYFTMPDGLVAHLRIFEGGYVMLFNMRDICVQVPQETFEALVEQLV